MTVWYLARALGLAAMVALSVSTVLGALVSGRHGRPDSRVVWQYVHRAAALLGVLLLIGHIAAVVADSKSGVGISAVVVPFTAGYRPVAVALGTIAMYLLVFVAVTGAARGRMASSVVGARVWRGIHLAAYGSWGLAVAHGFLAGTDPGRTWVRLLDVVAIAAVATAVAVRLRRRSPAVPGVRVGLARPVPVRVSAHPGGNR